MLLPTYSITSSQKKKQKSRIPVTPGMEMCFFYKVIRYHLNNFSKMQWIACNSLHYLTCLDTKLLQYPSFQIADPTRLSSGFPCWPSSWPWEFSFGGAALTRLAVMLRNHCCTDADARRGRRRKTTVISSK